MNINIKFLLVALASFSALNAMDSDLLTLTEVKQDGITAYERESQKRAEAAQQRAKEKEQTKYIDELLLEADFKFKLLKARLQADAMRIEYLECIERGDFGQANRIRKKMLHEKQ